jgi:hypothetical protein
VVTGELSVLWYNKMGSGSALGLYVGILGFWAAFMGGLLPLSRLRAGVIGAG